MIAKTAMDAGCIRTRVTTTDDDSSGIVFRFLNDELYYFVEANAGDYLRIVRQARDTRETLASVPWSGDFSAGPTLLTCSSKRGVQGGRVGFYNRRNDNARRSHLSTMSNSQGKALVRTWTVPCFGFCDRQCTQNIGFPPDPAGIAACIEQCIANTCGE